MKILYKLRILYNYIVAKYELRILNSNNLRKFQDKKVKKHLKYISSYSKFYSTFLDPKKPDLKDFPIINKTIMMENFSDLCTVAIKTEDAFEIAINSEKNREFSEDYKNYTVALSSGTSGNRGLVVVNDFDKSLWTGRILAKLLPKNLLTKERIAFFLRANNNVYESLHSKIINFNYFDLMKDIETNMTELSLFNPTILAAPPSMLLIIADYMKEKKIVISPKFVISVAEVLYDFDREKLEETFSQKIHQIYQATEGFLGHTCKYGVLHLNEDMIFVEKEYIDNTSGRFVPVITDFRRRTQPIIRYRLNDILVEKKEKCLCGSPFLALEKIEGREDDTFLFSSGNRDIPIFSDFISRSIILSSDEIIDYYVCQTKINDIKIYLKVKNCENLKKIKNEIELNFLNLKKRFKISEMNLSFTNDYFLEKGRKRKRVERLF